MNKNIWEQKEEHICPSNPTSLEHTMSRNYNTRTIWRCPIVLGHHRDILCDTRLYMIWSLTQTIPVYGDVRSLTRTMTYFKIFHIIQQIGTFSESTKMQLICTKCFQSIAVINACTSKKTNKKHNHPGLLTRPWGQGRGRGQRQRGRGQKEWGRGRGRGQSSRGQSRGQSSRGRGHKLMNTQKLTVTSFII